jgi:hypothetical protein
MWESRRDFQEEWEGWKAGFMAFHAFHSSAFPTLAVLHEVNAEYDQLTTKAFIGIDARIIRKVDHVSDTAPARACEG